MKKTFCALAVAALALLNVSACSANEGLSAAHEDIPAKTVSFDTLAEMETFSDLIVTGVRMESEAPAINYVEGSPAYGYTFSEFRITGICKDSTSAYKENDTLIILENEFYSESENKIYHIAGYNMMVEGREYLLFLDKAHYQGRDYFVASGVNFGTISLENDSRTTRRSESGADYAAYEPIWNAARDKYLADAG